MYTYEHILKNKVLLYILFFFFFFFSVEEQQNFYQCIILQMQSHYNLQLIQLHPSLFYAETNVRKTNEFQMNLPINADYVFRSRKKFCLICERLHVLSLFFNIYGDLRIMSCFLHSCLFGLGKGVYFYRVNALGWIPSIANFVLPISPSCIKLVRRHRK